MPAGSAVGVSSDGKTLGVGSEAGTVKIFDVPSRDQLGPPVKPGGGSVGALAFDLTASLVASGGFDGRARLA